MVCYALVVALGASAALAWLTCRDPFLMAQGNVARVASGGAGGNAACRCLYEWLSRFLRCRCIVGLQVRRRGAARRTSFRVALWAGCAYCGGVQGLRQGCARSGKTSPRRRPGICGSPVPPPRARGSHPPRFPYAPGFCTPRRNATFPRKCAWAGLRYRYNR